LPFYSQRLPADAFLHAQVGVEKPLNLAVKREVFWRVAAGKTFVQGPWGRTWSPMVELLAVREFVVGEPESTEVLPQLRVTLSRPASRLRDAGLHVAVQRSGARSAVVADGCRLVGLVRRRSVRWLAVSGRAGRQARPVTSCPLEQRLDFLDVRRLPSRRCDSCWVISSPHLRRFVFPASLIVW
jgi:hypothetical protein